MTAFVLGAGRGTRLRPLTSDCPKPLLELRPGRRLIEDAFDSLIDQAHVDRLLVNTHWAAERWVKAYPEANYRGVELKFIHEPELLDTGGGLANIWPHWQRRAPASESLWLYNGDILSSAPLAPLLQAHEASDNLCTLLLRPEPGNAAFEAKQEDPLSGQVADLRGTLGRQDLPQLSYGGIALIRSDFARYLQPIGTIFGLVESWLELIQAENKLGALVVKEGDWADLGTMEEWNRVAEH